MTDNLYLRITDKLRAAGFEHCRDSKRSIWKKKTEDGEFGISVSRNIRNLCEGRALLRDVGLRL